MHFVFPVIATDRLLLRQFNETDLEHVYRGLSDPEVISYYGISFSTLEETKKQLNWFSEIEKSGTGIWWAICSADNTSFYGAVGLYYLKQEHKKAELGFWLVAEQWGRGITTEAVQKVIQFGFDEMDLHRIEAQIETGNNASKRVMKKLFFSYEGTLRDYEIKNGRYISLDIFSMLNPADTN